MIYSVDWNGQHISLNDWYSGGNHWTVRDTMKRRWHQIFKEVLEPLDMPKLIEYELELVYNSRLDPTNTITMVKLFEDTMKDLGLIIDDSKKYCKKITLLPNLEMKNKHYIINIKKIR
jgi:hypothetical protein